jgi:hypothetical protein
MLRCNRPLTRQSRHSTQAGQRPLWSGFQGEKVGHQLGKLMMYLQPPADYRRSLGDHLTVGRVPTPECAQFQETDQHSGRATIIATSEPAMVSRV